MSFDYLRAGMRVAISIKEHVTLFAENIAYLSKHQTNRRSFTQDATITVIPAPLTVGTSATGESARQIHQTGPNRFAVLYEVRDNTSVSHYKWMPSDGHIHAPGTDLDFGSVRDDERKALHGCLDGTMGIHTRRRKDQLLQHAKIWP